MADQRAANLLGAFALAVGDSVTRAIQEVGYGASAPAAIRRIGAYPGQPIESLSQALQLSHSATVRLVDRLGVEGLVRRERDTKRQDSDRRAVALYLTPQGEHCFNRILESRYDALRPLLDSLSEQEQGQLTAIIAKLLPQLASTEQSARICRLCDIETCWQAGCPLGDPAPGFTPGRSHSPGGRSGRVE